MISARQLTVGESVPATVMHAVPFERPCRVHVKTMAGGPLTVYSSPEDARANRAACWPESQLLAVRNYGHTSQIDALRGRRSDDEKEG